MKNTKPTDTGVYECSDIKNYLTPEYRYVYVSSNSKISWIQWKFIIPNSWSLYTCIFFLPLLWTGPEKLVFLDNSNSWSIETHRGCDCQSYNNFNFTVKVTHPNVSISIFKQTTEMEVSDEHQQNQFVKVKLHYRRIIKSK